MTKQFKLSIKQTYEPPKTPFENALAWMKSRQELLAVGVLVLLLLFFGIPYYMKSQKQAGQDASNQLSMAVYYVSVPVDAERGPFKTEAEKYQQTLQSFQRILNNYGGTPAAKVAQYYVGKCQYMLAQYPQAYASFDAALLPLKGSPLGDAAVLGKVYCMAVQDKTTEANAMFEAFLKEFPKSYLAPEARLAYASSLMKIKNETKAQEQLKLLAKDSPDTFWGKEAEKRLAAF